jgi:hypothetical protein
LFSGNSGPSYKRKLGQQKLMYLIVDKLSTYLVVDVSDQPDTSTHLTVDVSGWSDTLIIRVICCYHLANLRHRSMCFFLLLEGTFGGYYDLLSRWL